MSAPKLDGSLLWLGLGFKLKSWGQNIETIPLGLNPPQLMLPTHACRAIYTAEMERETQIYRWWSIIQLEGRSIETHVNFFQLSGMSSRSFFCVGDHFRVLPGFSLTLLSELSFIMTTGWLGDVHIIVIWARERHRERGGKKRNEEGVFSLSFPTAFRFLFFSGCVAGKIQIWN